MSDQVRDADQKNNGTSTQDAGRASREGAAQESGKRQAFVQRETGETSIRLQLALDGEGDNDIETGIPFLDHMLDLLAKHGHFDLYVRADGDLEVDGHHTTEDVGICLGQAIREALGDKKGIHRYGNAFVPMDETLAQAVVDLSNRPHLEWRAAFPQSKVGDFDTELVHEWAWKLALEARMNVHIILHHGQNTHHMIEAIFKALGRALDEATMLDPRVKGIPSTKGKL